MLRQKLGSMGYDAVSLLFSPCDGPHVPCPGQVIQQVCDRVDQGPLAGASALPEYMLESLPGLASQNTVY